MAGPKLRFCKSCNKQIEAQDNPCPYCGADQNKGSPKSKVAAGLLAIFLGNLGIHRFYLGQWWGLFYLLFFWTLIPGLIAFIEGIVFLATSDEKWNEKYNNGGAGSKDGSAALIVVAVVAVFAVIGVIGILAAIAIPAYQDYTVRAHVSEGMAAAAPAQLAVAEYAMNHNALPKNNAEANLQEPPSSPYVQAVNILPDGAIEVRFSNTAHLLEDKTIVFSLRLDAPEVSWDCTGGTLDKKYRPTRCR